MPDLLVLHDTCEDECSLEMRDQLPPEGSLCISVSWVCEQRNPLVWPSLSLSLKNLR